MESSPRLQGGSAPDYISQQGLHRPLPTEQTEGKPEKKKHYDRNVYLEDRFTSDTSCLAYLIYRRFLRGLGHLLLLKLFGLLVAHDAANAPRPS